MENVQTNSVPENAKEYSSFRYALGAVLAFFGFSSKTHRGSKKRAKLVADIVTYIVLLLGGFLMVYPFWWMIASSFANTSTPTLSGQVATMIWWPTNALPGTTADGRELNLFYNYHILFTEGMRGLPGASNGFAEGYTYWRAVLNNLIYSIVPVVVGVVMSAAAAFSFAKIEWVGRNAVFMFLLAAIMVPGPSIMTTQYVMYVSFGWLSGQGYPNAWMTLTIPGMFGAIMTAFFIRQFLFGLPTSIVEAAKIDGAGYFRIFCSFIMPLAMPAIVAQGLLSFMGCWNNYMGSLIFIPQSSLWVNLPHAMTIMNNNYTSDVGPVMAAAVMCVLPVIILFAIFQKMIIGSLMLTGSKE